MKRSLWLAGALCVGLLGCVPRARVTYVQTAPPPPQYEEVENRPGYVWVRGHWQWDGNRYVWERGHWETERRGYVWRDGGWQNRGDRYEWVDGQWDASAVAPSGGVIIRDHRQNPPPVEQQQPGTIIVPSRER